MHGVGSHRLVVEQRWSAGHEVGEHAGEQTVVTRPLQHGTWDGDDRHTFPAPQSVSTEHSCGDGGGCIEQGMGLQVGPVEVLVLQSRPLGQSLWTLHKGVPAGGGSTPGQTGPVTTVASEPKPPSAEPPEPLPPEPFPPAPPRPPPVPPIPPSNPPTPLNPPEPPERIPPLPAPPDPTPPVPPPSDIHVVPPVPPEPPICLTSSGDNPSLVGPASVGPASVETTLPDLLQPLPTNTERPAKRVKDRSTLWDLIPEIVAGHSLRGKTKVFDER